MYIYTKKEEKKEFDITALLWLREKRHLGL